MTETVVSAPGNLRCEYREAPLGIDERRPCLSWEAPFYGRGEGQAAYRVLVASRPELLEEGKADLWDSGRVESDETAQFEYAGAELASRQRVWWVVRCWERAGRATGYSEPAWFEMGLLEPADWQGQWIGVGEACDAPLLRRAFTVDKPVARARAYVCGLGLFELRLNGQKVGDHVLDPNNTNYDDRNLGELLYPFEDRMAKRAPYVTFDVTELLTAGANAVGVMLGNGWYNQRGRTVEGRMWYGPPRLMLQLEIDYTDGTRAVIATDEDWCWAPGPLTANNLFYGEVYDARREQPGWDAPGFDAGAWQPAQPMPAPSGPLRAQAGPPDKVIETVLPVSITELRPGVYVVDYGRNFSGWVRLRARGEAGRAVTLRFAEELYDDGSLNFESAGGMGSGEQIQSDTYLCHGAGEEIYEPRFTWHCFRYAEVTGFPGTPAAEDLTGVVVHMAMEPAGEFACSNPLLTRLNEVFRATLLANCHMAVVSDCPHRERLGYTGDGQLTAEAGMLNFHAARFYSKWLDDIGDAQNRNTGFVPHSAPFGGGGGGPAWGSAYPIVAWQLYRHYGDRRVLARHFAGLQRWVEYLGTRTDDDGIVVREEPESWCLGDWALPRLWGLAGEVPIPPSLVNTAYYGFCAALTAEIAAVLGEETVARQYRDLHRDIARNFHRKFYDEVKGCYGPGEYGADAVALALGAVPEALVDQVVDHLAGVYAANGYHVDTGIICTPLVLDMLTAHGRADVAYKLMTQTSYPSFGYMLAEGATTLWENWAKEEGTHCHPMYGSFSAWLYRTVAGLQIAPDGAGFRKLLVKPYPVEDLTSASASIATLRGPASVSWHKAEGRFTLHLRVPQGATAAVCLPIDRRATVREGGTVCWQAGAYVPGIPGITGARAESDRVVIEVESGEYRFEAE